MKGTVSVVIVTYNGRALLATCLSALFSGTRLPDEVIVVDNASTDGTARWLADTYPSIRVLPCVANLGFASANNRGIAASRGSAVLTLNNDTQVHPEMLARLMAVFDHASAAVGAVMSTLVFADRPSVIASSGLETSANGVVRDRRVGEEVRTDSTPYPIFGPSAGAALYRRAALDDVGVFDPAFFMYLEDADLAWRLRLRRWETLSVPDAVVRHAVSASAGYGSPRKAYYLARNRWWCILKNWPAELLREHAGVISLYDAAAVAYATATGDWASLSGRAEALSDFATIMRARHRIQTRVTAPLDEIRAWLLRPLPLVATLRERRMIAALRGVVS